MKLAVYFMCFMLCQNGASTATSHESEVSSLLGVLTKGTNLHSALKIIKQLKVTGNLYETLIKNSPFLREVFTDLENKDAAAKVALDILEGHMPNIKDLVDIVKPNPDVRSIIGSNKVFKQVTSLFSKPDFETSLADIENATFLWTGHHFDLQSVFVKEPRTDKYNLVDTKGNKYWNLVQYILFLSDNWHLALKDLNDNSANTHDFIVKSFQLVLQLDFTHLNQVHGSSIDGPKYSVSVTGRPNQDIVQIKSLMKTSKAAPSTFEGIEPMIQVMTKVQDIYNTALREALSGNSQVLG